MQKGNWQEKDGERYILDSFKTHFSNKHYDNDNGNIY